MMTMHQEDIALTVARAGGISQRSATRVLADAVEAIRASLERGDEVTLRGLGSFRLALHRERRRQDPSDRSAMLVIAAHRRVKFVPAKKLMTTVAGLPAAGNATLRSALEPCR